MYESHVNRVFGCQVTAQKSHNRRQRVTDVDHFLLADKRLLGGERDIDFRETSGPGRVDSYHDRR